MLIRPAGNANRWVALVKEMKVGASLELEVDTGDILQILRPDGGFGGKAVYALSTLYSVYKELFDEESWEFLWFKKLDELTENDPGVIYRIMYSGNWNYDERDYERLRKCEGYLSEMSKEDFIRTITEVGNMWTPIDDIITIVNELLEAFPKMGEATDWYSPQDTVEGFQGLLNTLLLAKSRFGEKVRFIGS